ncbi:hypothetical protein PTKIN_Ptkin19aG0072400 [Pterospermum kingtungense]
MEELVITKVEPIPISANVSPNLDWQNKDGLLRNVRDQGPCQSCWAVIAIQVLEAVCPLKAFEWLKDNEVYGEKDYPYQGRRGKCESFRKPSIKVKIKEVETINGGLRQNIFSRVSLHPVAAVVYAFDEFIKLKDEIYEGPKKKPTKKKIPHHAVAIIGYGTEGNGADAKHYWIVMNSWGKEWGVNGVGRVSRDHKLNGSSLPRRICYPVV